MMSVMTGSPGLAPNYVAYLVGLVTVGALIVASLWPRKLSAFPFVNGKRPGEFLATNAKIRFQVNAGELIDLGFSKSRKPFAMLTDTGTRLIFSYQSIDSVRNHPDLSFGKNLEIEMFGRTPGFDVFSESSLSSRIVAESLRTKLSQSLAHLTEPVSEEADHSLRLNWTDNSEWHQIILKESILQIVAQLSSRVFLGPEICRNPDWLRITARYTVDVFSAAWSLRRWPSVLHPILHWFLPQCRKIRAEVREARSVIQPVLDRRRKYKAELISKGKVPEKFNDAMEWIEETAKGQPYDPAVAQLGYSLGAIHTTTDMLTQVIFDLCEHPELIPALRKEIIAVLPQEGWKKSSLYKLKLMDSVLKESQRLKPVAMTTMQRVTTEKVHLPDGTEIPKGACLNVASDHMRTSSAGIYPEAEKFDGYRFLRLREDHGQERTAQLVSTSVDHIGFGHGQHACPGRFFAANEMKVALCHMLLKYDWKLPGGSTPPPKVMRMGFGLHSDPTAALMVRRRREEINLQALGGGDE